MNTAFDEAIERSADPLAVRRAMESLDGDRLRSSPELVDTVAAVVSASRFLTRLLLADDRALDVLADLDRRPPLRAGAADPEQLARWKRLELLRIAGRDLVGRAPLDAVGAHLAALADDVLRTAWELAGSPDLAVIGMGKLGAVELNYASDVDVVLVGEGDAKPLLEVARRCFRVDADLRPEGRSGPLVRSLASYQAYWERWAQPWEFQALLKARPIPGAGPPGLGDAFAAAAAEQVWHRPFGAEELRSVRSMKARAEGEVAKRGLSDREVKRGRGGIRDIEFAVQLLQLVHGRQDEALRVPGTLPALSELAAADYVDGTDATGLEAAYRFLRTVEHRLQLVEDQQVHAVPADVAGRARLARTMRYRDDQHASAVERFDDDLRRHQATAREIHERLYFRPLLEAFTGDGVMPVEAVEARLAAFGFRDAQRTRDAVRALTKGLTRTSRLMQQLLPLLLGWLSESPDPDLGLLGLRNLVEDGHRAAQLVSEFRESPETARRLCLLLGTSRLLRRAFEQSPDLVADLSDDARLRSRTRAEMAEAATTALRWRTDVEERRLALYRLKQAEELRIAARDVLGLDSVRVTGESLTAVAEAALDAALTTLAPPEPMAIVAMGRFGGAELSYASDLDVLLVYQGGTSADFAAAEAVAEALLKFVNGATPAMRVYTLDIDLRPEGKQGPLARSLDGYRNYYERWAKTWERQALVRARPVAGDSGLGDQFQAMIEPFVWDAPFTEEDAREVRRIKARVERERIPPGEDPQFHLKLGRGSLSDVEWTAQLLQLQHRVRSPGTMAALDALVAAGALSGEDAQVLGESYRFCEAARNHLFLVRGAPSDSLPTAADQLSKLARSLGTSATELRDDYRRVTRRARTVMERLFYNA